jgi:hypothetical protein
MKKLGILFLIVAPLAAHAQSGFKEGYLIDKSGEKYEGFLKFEPGGEKESGELVFKESKKGKKEVYNTSYVKTFKIATDSFTVLNNFAYARNKTKPADFAKVLLVAPAGVIYSVEYKVEKSSGHAATEYKDIVENTRYFIFTNGKLALLNQTNFATVANLVADCAELKTNIIRKKRKFADLQKVIEEYHSCKTK